MYPISNIRAFNMTAQHNPIPYSAVSGVWVGICLTFIDGKCQILLVWSMNGGGKR